jgi:hypothetical protein
MLGLAAALSAILAVPPAKAHGSGLPSHFYRVRCVNISGTGAAQVLARPSQLNDFYGIDEEPYPSGYDPYPGVWDQAMYYRIWYYWGGRWYYGMQYRLTEDSFPASIPDVWDTSQRAWVAVGGGYYGTPNYAAAQDEVWAFLPRYYTGSLYIAVQTYWDRPVRGGYVGSSGGPYSGGTDHYVYATVQCA